MKTSWYNNSVKKRGDIQKQDIKKDLTSNASNDWKARSFKKRIYINYRIEWSKAPKIYIRPYYNLIGAKKKIENVNDQNIYYIKNKYLCECGVLNEKNVCNVLVKYKERKLKND